MRFETYYWLKDRGTFFFLDGGIFFSGVCCLCLGLFFAHVVVAAAAVLNALSSVHANDFVFRPPFATFETIMHDDDYDGEKRAVISYLCWYPQGTR
jgi:hypothetical protein